MKDQAKLKDELSISRDDASSLSVDPGRQEYEVISESGLFKNGKQYDKGSMINLDPKTAAHFIVAGDIKEVSNEK